MLIVISTDWHDSLCLQQDMGLVSGDMEKDRQIFHHLGLQSIGMTPCANRKT
jgi:hypothetical protein